MLARAGGGAHKDDADGLYLPNHSTGNVDERGALRVLLVSTAKGLWLPLRLNITDDSYLGCLMMPAHVYIYIYSLYTL